MLTRSVMSLQADILWTIGIIVIAFLVWLNAAKTQQRAREDRERLDKIIQLLAKPETTLEDVRRATTSIDDSLSKTPLAGSVVIFGKFTERVFQSCYRFFTALLKVDFPDSLGH